MRQVFSDQMESYRLAINADIAAYAGHVRQYTHQQYGEYGALVTGAFLDMLERGGKRLRGALAIAGYEMYGGQDLRMITRAATALEMIHTSWLVLDDIQDRSDMRRGRPTVHEMLSSYHRKHNLSGDAAHAGVSLAINAGVAGAQAAQVLLAGLSVEDELRCKVMGIVAQASTVTSYGQTYDIMNELSQDVSREDLERTLEWKTAYYTFLNPLCVGLVLAGAGCEDTDAIRSYALSAGKAFQITDDIMGVFGSDEQMGKTALNDIREGKQTLLTYHALAHASAKDRTFLRQCLGNARLTKADFERCQQIIRDSGGLEFARSEAKLQVDAALAGLDDAPAHWQQQRVNFLRDLASSLLDRQC